MEHRTIQEILDTLLGQKLIYITCEADILDIGFEKKILHVSSLGRIVKNNRILLTTFDYQSWDEIESTNNDEWYNVEKHRQEIVGGIVVSVKISECGDLFISLNNGIEIEVFVSEAEHHYGCQEEQWVLFDNKEEKSSIYFLTQYNDGIEYTKY